jgi:YidC/Oxa1 family membrane protein insertase
MVTIGYWICYPFSALVRLLYTVTGSYGVSLILFTLVIKLVLLPFQMKSKKSMVRMNRMSGRMQELKKRYANNQAKMNEEVQKLYAEEGVNPMSGCLWSFLPLPILMALYYVIREPVAYFMNFGSRAAAITVLDSAKEVVKGLGLTWTTMKSGADGAYAQIEIIKALASNADKAPVKEFFAANPNWVNVNYQFLGIDLSALPSAAIKTLSTGFAWAAAGLLLIPILSAVLQILVMKITMSTQAGGAGENPSSKMMMWTMPLFSLWIGFTLPAALGVYWIAQSAFTAIQELLLGKFYNGKLEAEEEEHQRQVEDRRRVRQEEARRLQEEQRQLSVKQQAKAQKRAKSGIQAPVKGKRPSTTEAGRVGDRPYARGRAYADTHYDYDNEAGRETGDE